MDIVYLHGIKLSTIIGVWDWERKLKQTLTANIELSTDTTVAANSDQLDDALNYQRVAERVMELAASSEFALLESLAEAIAELILAEFAVEAVSIDIDKGPAVRDVKSVGVRIQRSRAN